MRSLAVAFALLIPTLPAGPQEKVLRVPGDYPSLQKAIDAAGPGDTILAEAGTYRERVRLKAGVILRSAGDDRAGKLGLARAEATRIDGEGKAEGGSGVVLAEGSVLDGFTVTGIGAFDQADYDRHHATQGEDLPDDRGIAGRPDHPPAVSVPGVTAVVRNNIVRDNGEAGIGCTAGAGGRNGSRIVRNVVFRNMGGGIACADGATPLVEGNRCSRNLRSGIGCRNSAPVVVGNECFDNVRAGIGIREGGTPVVRGNRCHRNRRAGIGIRMEGTAPLVEDNECQDNAMAGIGCRAGARPFIRGNRCHGNALAGIGVREGAHPVISGNRCWRNLEAGIGIQGKSTALVSDNECWENEQAGIGHRDDSETVVSGNHLHHNKLSGIGFDESKAGKSTVERNRILDNGRTAVGIHAGWSVRLTDNVFSRDGGLPPLVQVDRGSRAELTSNTFRGGGVAGLRVEGRVRAVDNRFEGGATGRAGGGPPQAALWALAGSDVLFAENSVKGWREALRADAGAAATSYGNTVAD